MALPLRESKRGPLEKGVPVEKRECSLSRIRRSIPCLITLEGRRYKLERGLLLRRIRIRDKKTINSLCGRQLSGKAGNKQSGEAEEGSQREGLSMRAVQLIGVLIRKKA